MGGHIVVLVVTKLKLLVSGGHANVHILPALLLPFILRVPLAVRMPASLPGVVYSLRLLIFQLNRILFRRTPMPNNQRMARTLRLLYNRMIHNGRSMMIEPDAETLHALSMASL
ncbi:hypothetical protein IEQ34_007935 [Dendrobium chrysotoxum]|uniref:Secreted protein n=1 Tax=Dendrobium chrysotoxum TaxID=161865 RepID=A0AAV7H761_DENCH|nr:hypothetical protein IEQ34_007935 [Dendrobium chrysotoxum]